MKVTRGIIIIVLFLTPILLSYNTVPAVVSRGNTTLSSSQNWLDGWQVRKLHTIEGSLGAGTDYQIRIIVHYGSGIDTDENIFCTSFCNDDFSDIRFTDDDGITELDYWMEQSHVSDNATFWVEVRDNLDTSQIIFVYYNNTAAVSSSNGTNTFLLFDDFEGVADSEPSTDLWYVKSGLNGIRLDGNSHLILDDEVDADDRGSIYTREVYGSCNLSILSKTWCSSGTVRNMNWGAFSNYTVSDVVTYSANSWTDGLRFSTVNNGILTSTDGYVDNMNAWHLYDLKWFPGDAYLFQDDNEKFHHTTNIPDSLCNVSLGEGTSGGGAYALVDWVVLRNCIASEPSHGEWGTLEYAPPLIDTPSAGWEFRKSHSIEGSLGAGNDYQVAIVVHHGNGVDSADEVYCNEYCLPNFGDIRFTDNDGITELDYWMEESQSDNATFWVEILDTLDYNQVIYVYFGNPDATDASDGECTFIAWDDFDDGYTLYDVPKTSRGWSIVNQGGDICRIENNPTGRSGMGLRYAEDGAGELNLHIFNIWDQTDHDIAVHFNFYWDIRDYQFYFNVYDIDDWYPTVTLLSQTSDYDWEYYTDDTWYEYQNGLEPNMDVWYELEQQTDMDDGLDTSLIIDGYEYQGANNEDAIDGFDCVRFAAHGDYVDDYYIDDFYVRKFVSSEPIHSVWGSLESALSINSPTTLTFEVSTIGHSVTW
ncbi:MAG: DUF2341 domain-containing protein, partial [Candidatus Thorarchaeota archaeon]|nr:DUF2341 domain-containing protein [Candidatus Thorarchaeota archaeon]